MKINLEDLVNAKKSGKAWLADELYYPRLAYLAKVLDDLRINGATIEMGHGEAIATRGGR